MKVLDITDKLKTQEKPVLKVKGVELPVNDDAITFLTVIELMESGNPSVMDIMQASKAIFGEDGFEKLYGLNLNLENFMTVITEAMELVSGEGSGE